MVRTVIRRVLIATVALAIAAPSASGQANVLTHHNDNRRTGANLRETTLTVAKVRQKFGRLWTLFVDGQISAQPLYVSGLTVAGRTVNAIIVATMHNTIYVYDADTKPTQPQSRDALVWAQWLTGSSRRRSSPRAFRSRAAAGSRSIRSSRSSARRCCSTAARSTSASRRITRATALCTAGCSHTTRRPCAQTAFWNPTRTATNSGIWQAGEFGNQNTPPRNGLPKNFYVAVYGLKP